MEATALPSRKRALSATKMPDHSTSDITAFSRAGASSRSGRRPRLGARGLKVSAMLETWAAATKGRNEELKTYKNAKGAATMWDMAMRVVMVNLNDLERDHLDGLSWVHAKRMWATFEKKSVPTTMIIIC
jgi:hypothetical protein